MEMSLSQCGKRAMKSCLSIESIRIQTFISAGKALHASGERKYSDAPSSSSNKALC